MSHRHDGSRRRSHHRPRCYAAEQRHHFLRRQWCSELRPHPRRESNQSARQGLRNNIEVAFQAPDGGGILKTLHYIISDIPDSTGYQPRVADTRVGYFTTSYTDLAKYDDRETRVRYINRWHLEKADPKLQVSPQRTRSCSNRTHDPVRYRRWVREGILAWNSAFEKVGISNAIEVYYQDAASQAHMDKDPEDVNYNFVPLDQQRRRNCDWSKPSASDDWSDS